MINPINVAVKTEKKKLTPTYVFAKLACAKPFESPKSPSWTVLFASRKTMNRCDC